MPECLVGCADFTGFGTAKSAIGTRFSWPVRSGSSQAEELPSRPLSKKQAWSIWNYANQLEAKSRKPGCREGELGRSAIALLWVMLFKRHNWRSGRLDPSYDTLAYDAHMSRSTVYRALKKLIAVGIVSRIRRCFRDTKEDGSFCLRQDTNQYHFNLPSLWKSLKALWTPLQVTREDLGLEPFIPDQSGLYAASEAIRAGAKAEATFAALKSDPGDKLGTTMARLGALTARQWDVERARTAVVGQGASSPDELKAALQRRLVLSGGAKSFGIS